MKTSMNQNVEIALLDWPSVGDVVLRQPKFRRPAKVPQLRLVSVTEPRKHELFNYATAAKSMTGFWETIVYAALALSAAGAVVVAFGI